MTRVTQSLADMTPLLTELLLRQIDGVGGPAESRICRTHLVRRASA
jgi:DNA-binding LacI/PurR family transcriptional regulator